MVVELAVRLDRHQKLMRDVVGHFGLDVVWAYMEHVQDNAEESVRRVLDVLGNGSFTSAMDNGARIQVAISIDAKKRRASIDFTGTSAQTDNNFNAPAPDVLFENRGDGTFRDVTQAAGLGALEAGIRFVAAYPITPASDVLEWMAGGLEQLGGQLLQAEDELAAINMIIGAAFGGVPAFTATSGPGLALMTESIGLAVASETPVTILNVMRGGPSTGIPTKSEQSDLNIALNCLHGDAPHLVLAPLDIADCVFTTGWAVHLAQRLQTAAIVLSDQFIGQSTAVVSEPLRYVPVEAVGASEEGDYLRYRLTPDGISALAFPGDADHRYTADGLEHNEKGTPSAKQSDHQYQLDKRLHKLT